MAYEELKVLAESYPSQERDALITLGGEYQRRYELELLELAATAADVKLDDIVNAGLDPEADPQLADALDRLGYTDDALASLRGDTPEQLTGHISRIKGTYFEVLVKDRLNDGESVGGFKLAPGEEVSLAEKENQPGYDLIIRNKETDEVIDELQLKAVKDWSEVARSLSKYDDTPHVVTAEHADSAAANDMVTATDIRNESLTNTVRGQVDEATESLAEDILGQGLEAALDTVPFASLPLIIGTETLSVFRNRTTLRESWQRGKGRLARAGVYSTIGAAVNATPAAPASIPITVGLQLVQTRVGHRVAMGNHLEEKTQGILRALETK
jgi:hypothetical protein